ncbi:hypothetical protein MNBD_GAMMA09-3599 [hydrothermal vent metagenome]|uniref:Lipoprotein n=1 Tax=hydrothermal vent metagenome TaxID=652676 RepID=A0A3B0XH00_9ZZZZ
MKKSRFKYGFSVALACCFFSIMSACTVKLPAGKWVSPEISTVNFMAVELSAIDSAYPAVCIEAQNELNMRLLEQMPAQLKPLVFQVSQKVANQEQLSPARKIKNTDAATLQLMITDCLVDVDQSGGVFEFYLTLSVDVKLMKNNRALMKHHMQSFERVQIGEPDPAFEFSFEEPVQRILALFNNGRIFIAD